MVVRKLSKIIRFAHDLALFSSFLQGIIQTNLSSTLAASVGFVRPVGGEGRWRGFILSAGGSLMSSTTLRLLLKCGIFDAFNSC